MTPPTARAPSRAWFLTSLAAATAAGIFIGVRWHSHILHTLGTDVNPGAAVEATAPAPDTAHLWTCGMHPLVIQDHPGDCPICHMKLTPLAASPQVANQGGAPAGGVTIDPAMVQNMGIRTAVAAMGPLVRHARMTATVREPQSAAYDINLRVSGWVKELHAGTDGMEVRRGDPLFELSSPDLTRAIDEFIAARQPANAPQADALHAPLARAAESRLLALGMTPQQIDSFAGLDHAPDVVTFLSPIDGYVSARDVTARGAAVEPGMRVLRLSQRDVMWVEGRAAETDLAAIRVGQHATISLSAAPGATTEGLVTFIAPRVDEATRRAIIRVEVQNPDGLLREGQLATMDVSTGAARDALLLPRESVIDTGVSHTVFVSLGNGRFDPRRVVPGETGDDGLIEITSGIAPGETVVTSGQFLLDSESRLREAVAKFLSAGPAQAAPAPPPPSAPISSEARAGVDAVVAAYLPIAESLGAVQAADTPLSVEAITSSLRTLRAAVRDPAHASLVDKAADAAAALQNQSLDEQRERFKALSAAVVSLVDAMPPTTRLFVVHCPMAPGTWLQRGEHVANPFYADEMKECGTVEREVHPEGKGAPR